MKLSVLALAATLVATLALPLAVRAGDVVAVNPLLAPSPLPHWDRKFNRMSPGMHRKTGLENHQHPQSPV